MVSWDGAVVLMTPRLVLRTFRENDLPMYAALNADPEVTRWLGGPMSRQDSDDIAAWAQECVERDGFGLIAVERKTDSAFIGMCGLHHQMSYPDDVEVAWRLAREYWGRGYATEAASAWLDHAFGPLQLDRVISITEQTNVRSLAVMGRLGMRFDHAGKVRDGDEIFDAVIYATTNEQWHVRRTARERLIGAWSVRRIQDRRSESDAWEDFGPDPHGVILYDPSGIVSVHLIGDGPLPSSTDYLGYWGRYVVVEASGESDELTGRIEHHLRGGHPSFLFDEEPERRFRLLGDELTLGDGTTSRRDLVRLEVAG